MPFDTKTKIIWTGAEKKINEGKTLYLIIQNGGQGTGTDVSGEIEVRFARSEVGQIKWCSYVGTEMDMNKCKPDQSLKPDGQIKIK